MTRYALRYDRVTIVVLLSVALAGYAAYVAMPRDQDPGFVIRQAQVLTLFPGASPDRVETLISDKLEKVVQEIPELDWVVSTSKSGASVLTVSMEERYTDMRPLWDTLRRKIDKARRDLPDGVVGPIVNDEFGDVFGVVLAITGEGFSYAELKQVADEVRDELLRLPEAAKVEIYGAQEERVFVEYHHSKLARVGLTPQSLLGVLQKRNIIVSGGAITVGGEAPERIVLEPSGNFESIADLQRTVIPVLGGREVTYLGDIADVYRGYIDPPQTKMRFLQERALGLGVSLRAGGNIIALGQQVKATLARLHASYPVGLDFHPVVFQPDEVTRLVAGFELNLYQAVGIVLAVMLLALGLRTGALVASLIPMTIVASLLVMSLFGIGLDQVSLAALIIALGMLVDNAIVMAESIMVRIGAGEDPTEAALASAAELRVPLLTSSLTTSAAFLPIYLAESATGEYTAPLFQVVTITLLCSGVLALTMTPLLAVRFMRVEVAADDREPFSGRAYRMYRAVLVWTLRHRWIALTATALVFATAMAGFGMVPKLFFPPTDRTMFTAQLELPVGTPIERNERVTEEVERHLATLRAPEGGEGVLEWAAFMGGGAPRFVLNYAPRQASPGYTLYLVNTSDDSVTDGAIRSLETFALDTFPDLEVKVRRLGNGPPVVYPIEVRISGSERDAIFGLADQVKAKLGSISGTKGILDDWGRRSKKLVVRVSQARARRAGVTNEDVAFSLQTVLSGFSNSQYREDEKVIPITLRSVAADRQDVDKIESLLVYSGQTGRSVPLKQVADVEPVWQASKVLRRNGLRTVTVKCDLAPGTTAAEVNAVLAPWLAEQASGWAPGYKYELGGEVETSGKANQSIADKLPIAGFIILMLLVAQFNSVRRAGIILATIPLGLIGVSFGLVVCRSYMGFMTFLGIISLAGIVINNAIVLLERVQLEIDEGLAPGAALVRAAQLRMRPILLTTATTIAGLLPLWLGGGAMWEPMAVAIIFGLLFSTALTLGVVPVLYAVLFRVDASEVG